MCYRSLMGMRAFLLRKMTFAAWSYRLAAGFGGAALPIVNGGISALAYFIDFVSVWAVPTSWRVALGLLVLIIRLLFWIIWGSVTSRSGGD